MAQADWELERRLAYVPSGMVGLVERFDGAAAFTEADLGEMERAFQKHFGKPLPVSTRGDRRRPPRHGLRPSRTLRPGCQPVATRRRMGAPLPHRKTRDLLCVSQCRARKSHRSAHPHRPGQHPSSSVGRLTCPLPIPRIAPPPPSVRTGSASEPRPNEGCGLRWICQRAWPAGRMRPR